MWISKKWDLEVWIKLLLGGGCCPCTCHWEEFDLTKVTIAKILQVNQVHDYNFFTKA